MIERASHRSAEDVRTTCSFARAEQLLGREYHGRFLIELLQNAADATRNAEPPLEDSSVVVQITEGPALLVANQGASMSPEVVIESLGHIGASTKAQGEAIGHKGIGFKSVLELTLTPEIYSGLQRSTPSLAVGFDPESALKKIRSESADWDAMVAQVQGLDSKDRYAAVPILRFPYWVETLPQDIVELRERGFDTVVRLPFDERFSERLGYDAGSWLETVQNAFSDVSDPILLLLGCFDEVRLEDRLVSRDERIVPKWEPIPREIGDGATREVVRVERNGQLSSRWRLFRSTMPDRPHLAGEAAVGIRVDEGSEVERVLPAVDGQPSSPFHLFFPTRIPSGSPFLLHSYFEVDAARTGFYRGSGASNEEMIEELAKLARIAVADAVQGKDVDLASLVNLVARAAEPEEPLARAFRSRLLELLDGVDWIPVQDGGGRQPSDLPSKTFIAPLELVQRIGETFPPSYIRRQTSLGLLSSDLGEAALALIEGRPSYIPDLWERLRLLCLPGEENSPWEGREAADSGFRSLIDLFTALNARDHEATQTLLGKIRGNPGSRLIPAVEAGNTRRMLPIPDPQERVPGQRSKLVMARLGHAEESPLVPPDELDLAFLPDGLLSDEERDQAKPLGVRQFTVDNVLDRLSGIEDVEGEKVDGEGLVRFLWQLLAREGISGFSTRRSVERASSFTPSEFFWCQPGRGREDETAQARQQRERYLAAVPLPCRDGSWQQAGRVAFGADWADWLEARAAGSPTSAARQRIAAYRAMERVSPNERALLAPPKEVLELLDDEAFYEEAGAGGSEAEEPDEAQREAHKHAFLLRLGVWEVPPIEAYESQATANRERFPWQGELHDTRQRMVELEGGWKFSQSGWAGVRHHNVYLAEDYRFLWSLKEMAERDTAALVTGLRLGAAFYAERTNAQVFCQTCRDGAGSHIARRHSSIQDGYPSLLALELKGEPWVPCNVDGNPLAGPVKPSDAWWHQRPPTGAAYQQSPWRLVPLCSPEKGVSEDLQRLAEVNTLEDARADAIERLLSEIRERFETNTLPVRPLLSGSARRAFIGLHRLLYERLSELLAGEVEAAVLERTGVLCELGEGLVYRPTGECRHDDGQFVNYVHHFKSSIPFVVLPRDRGPVATRLGIAPFHLTLTRRGDDEGLDVTGEVQAFHGDRIAELLAIVVHHSLGTQTLDPASSEFEERARRLQNLRIKQLDDLVVDAAVEGRAERVTLGEGTVQDLFLEGPTSSSPTLFHDLSGDDWHGRLRGKIAPFLATLLENPAYTHTFALYLQKDNIDEREEFLLELGITADEVEALNMRLGVVTDEERRRHERWFAALCAVWGGEVARPDLDPEELALALVRTDMPTDLAAALVERGGGEAARRDTGPGSALRLLEQFGADLQQLDLALRQAGDAGLDIRAARETYSQWMDYSRRRLAAVLATKMPPDQAKSRVRSLASQGPPSELNLVLDPAPSELLAPVVNVLQSAGFTAQVDSLANEPAEELRRLGDFSSVEQLDEQVSRLFDEEEQRRFLHERALQWRDEIRVLTILARTGPADTRTMIRAYDQAVRALLPPNPASPPGLRDALEELLGQHVTLAERISARLEETLNVEPPKREQLMGWAEEDGIATGRLSKVEAALRTPRRDRSLKIRKHSQELGERGVRPVPPPGLEPVRQAPPEPARRGPRVVREIKVSEGQERRKRELGEEGEQWAVAAVIGALMGLEVEARDAAIEEMSALLAERFAGPVVEKARGHAASARMSDLDEEERIDELLGLVHLSRESDAFGFDLIGWLPLGSDGAGRAMYLEVKNSADGSFHLSRSQWDFAEQLYKEDEGPRCAVLVVRRSRTGGPPVAMDLLIDPVSLLKDKHLHMQVDGYQLAYRTVGPS